MSWRERKNGAIALMGAGEFGGWGGFGWNALLARGLPAIAIISASISVAKSSSVTSIPELEIAE